MRVFIAGATGVLGRRVAERLGQRGARVAGLSRSAANQALLERLGVEPRAGDLFDEVRLRESVAGCDAVLHLATAIPTGPRAGRREWALNDRIRRAGTRALTSAALAQGCRFYLQQGLLHVYGDRAGEWVDETSPIPRRPPRLARSAADAERIVADARARGLPAAVLRFGTFYGPDGAHTIGLLRMAAAGRAVVIGNGRAFWNPIHLDDAADAVVRAVERAPRVTEAETLNVCDDEPVTVGALVRFVTDHLGARPPRRIPALVARWLLGAGVAEALTLSYRARNARAREALDWTPALPTYREGYAATIAAWRAAAGTPSLGVPRR